MQLPKLGLHFGRNICGEKPTEKVKLREGGKEGGREGRGEERERERKTQEGQECLKRLIMGDV